MRHAPTLVLTALFALSIPSRPLHATAIVNIGAFADAVDVFVTEVDISHTLAVRSAATPLFDHDPAGAARFKTALARHARERLSPAGLAVTPSSRFHLTFRVYGGTFAECPQTAFFMLEIHVVDQQRSYTDVQYSGIGVVENSKLEARLVGAALDALDEIIETRARHLAAPQ